MISEPKNIYEMYVENGNKAGFWVVRNSWGHDTKAVVLNVGGKQAGALMGEPPYYTNPLVLARLFTPKEPKGFVIRLSCPGTFGYTRIK